MKYFPIPIHTNQSFLKQWHPWIQTKVSKNFRRDKERVPDAAQNVRLRLLSKDFIGRWFYKHLTDELVDKIQAEYILGGKSITFIGTIQPFLGKRSSPDSLWKVSDLLKFARFNYRRYYYSIQNHTIDSNSILDLLGYPPGDYGILESLYRQGRLKPAELTEHECIELIDCSSEHGSICSVPECQKKHFSRGYCTQHYQKHILISCPSCDHGRKLLKSRGISLANRWTDPSVVQAVSKLRWNDSQLRPFLRDWRHTNIIKNTPQYIMRKPNKDGVAPGVDAGLLRYAEMIIENEVVNDFKRIARGDDAEITVFNKGMSPEIGDSERVAWESDEVNGPGARVRIFRDMNSSSKFQSMEHYRDLASIMNSAGLTEEESDVIQSIDLQEMTPREYSELNGKPLQRVNRIRVSALRKLRKHKGESNNPEILESAMDNVCSHYKCSRSEVLGSCKFGPSVLARTELFSHLFDSGTSIEEMVSHFGIAENMIVAAINRRVLRDMRSGSSRHC